jgi:nitrogen PTS system EIIA component
MMISDLVAAQAVLPALRAPSAKQMLQVMARLASQLSGVSSDILLRALQSAQSDGSIALGGGIALPHGRVTGLGRTFAVIARLEVPLDMAALDDRKVDLVAMLFSPEGSDAGHLQALAGLSRMLRNKAICEKLRGCGDAAAMHAVLTAQDARQAA